MEWAEMKRAELEAGGLRPAPITYEASDDVPWSGQYGEVQEGVESHSLGQNGEERGTSNVEGSHDFDEDVLLKEWLSRTGHVEDAWAEKLLGKRQSNEEG